MRKRLFALLTVCIAIAVTELLSFALLSSGKGMLFSRRHMLNDQELIIKSSGEYDPRYATRPDFMQHDVLHPYIGFVWDSPTHADRYGFRNEISPIQKKGHNKVILAITGGSFAYQTYQYGLSVLVDRLKRHDTFRGKDFLAIRLAVGGYKQPQQLMALNYLLSLGAEFDFLINMDGFNEAALPIAENVPQHTFPFFPRKWPLRVDLLSDRDMFRLVSHGVWLRDKRVQLAAAFGSPYLKHSFTFNLVWEKMDHVLQGRIAQANGEASKALEGAKSFAAEGPSRQYDRDEDLYRDIAAVWKRSSLSMNVLCVANGIRYLHVLQPNQYLPGSKPLTQEEMKQAYNPTHGYRKPVEDVYPYLIAAGHELQQAKVDFMDMTMLFAHSRETLYVDMCCHVNETGYGMIAEAIANHILNSSADTGSRGRNLSMK